MDLTSLPCDVLTGHVIQREGHWSALVINPPYGPLPGDVLYRGRVTLRYGLPFLFQRDYLLVAWVYDDFRREHRGVDALDFIRRTGDVFPRADVGGWRVTTGDPVELFLKQLDLAPGVQAFAYASEQVATPVARLDAAVWVGAGAEGWESLPVDDDRAPVLLRRAVPCWLVHPAALPELAARLELELNA